MKLNKLNDWLRVVADLGILIGIGLVLLQMKQNENLMRTQIMTQHYDSYSAYEASFAGENLPVIWEKSLLEPENLTLAEMRALEAVTFSPLFRWINLYKQHESGVLEDIDWKEEVAMDASWYFGSEYSLAWWEFVSKAMLDADFLPRELYDYIENLIRSPDATGPIYQYDTIQEILKRNRRE